jgi:hypothetical protein
MDTAAGRLDASGVSTLSIGATTEPSKYNKDGIVAAAVSVFAFCMTVSSCSVEVFTLDSATIDAWVTFWSIKHCILGGACYTSNLPLANFCASRVVRDQAMQSFAILATLFTFVGIVAGALDALKRAPFKYLSVVVFSVAWFWVMLGWAVVAGTYRQRFCDLLSYQERGFKMSSAFALNLITWFVMTFALLYHVVSKLSSR